MEIQNKKRTRQESDTEPEQEMQPRFFPKFLVISPSDPTKPLNLSPFAIEKGVKAIAGTPKMIKRLRSGDLLVEVTKRAHAENLLRSTEFVTIPTTCTPHKRLNSSRGVLRCRDLNGCSESEICGELRDQGVTHVRRITINRGGNRIPTSTLIVTFAIPELPRTLKVGYLIERIEPYIPNPMRCFQCQKFGHSKFNCNRNAICPKCGLADHDDDVCQSPVNCINCGGDHPAYAKSCPVWVKEKEIQKLVTLQKISFPDARKIVDKPQQPLYSSKVTVLKRNVGTQTENQIDPLQTNTQPETTVSNQTQSTEVKQTVSQPRTTQRPTQSNRNNQRQANTQPRTTVSNQTKTAEASQVSKLPKPSQGSSHSKAKSNNQAQTNMQPKTTASNQTRTEVKQTSSQPRATQGSDKSNSKNENKPRSQNKNMKPTLNRPTNRKGVDNPITSHNRYSPLDDDEFVVDMDEPEFEEVMDHQPPEADSGDTQTHKLKS